jgi:hypothetical protein
MIFFYQYTHNYGASFSIVIYNKLSKEIVKLILIINKFNITINFLNFYNI